MNKPIKAIVFAGGGSKGVYQIGAWKALNQLGEEFDIAVGTSIGSINAAFYVQNDFSEAEKMWNEVTAGDIMANGINFDVSFESIIAQKDNILPFIKNYFNAKSVDNTPFLNMTQRYFNAQKFFSSPIDYALMTVNYNGFGPNDLIPVEITKTDMESYGEDAWKWIAASSSCYPVFPPMEIEGKQYIDGGFYDNIPVASAIKLGAESVVVVDLKPDGNHEAYINHPDVTYIRPTKDLGSFMNFERNVLDRSKKRGFNDTMKAYGQYKGTQYTFVPSENGFEHIEKLSEIFIPLMTRAEAEFDFSPFVRYHRVNKLMGCTSILGEYCKNHRPSKVEMTLSAFELLMKAMQYDDEEDFGINEILFRVKAEVDRIYPMLEFDTESAFRKVREFIKDMTGKSLEIKKYDENRMMLIYVSIIRALQKTVF